MGPFRINSEEVCGKALLGFHVHLMPAAQVCQAKEVKFLGDE